MVDRPFVERARQRSVEHHLVNSLSSDFTQRPVPTPRSYPPPLPLPPLAIRRAPSSSGVPALVPGIRSNAANHLLAAAICLVGLGMEMGSTSERHAGQWKTSSGRQHISGWPHSQGCFPRASGRATICLSIPTMVWSKAHSQKSHSAMRESKPPGHSCPHPHTGQTR